MLLRFYFAISNYINSICDRAIYDGFYSSCDREYLSIYSLHRYINSFLLVHVSVLIIPRKKLIYIHLPNYMCAGISKYVLSSIVPR
jgi:hypothetical protein